MEDYFENAYFITGTAYAGKSTLARLLAERHGGILCAENYHDSLLPGLDKAEFPCLTYTRDLADWRDFIRRSPEEYEAWFDGVSKECEILELRILRELTKSGRPVFVDTNISTETLKRITPHDHVLVMLAEPEVSVGRFFDREDREKQFLYSLIMREPEPEKAMENYRRGLERINSRERFVRYLESGFNVIKRDETRSAEQTLALAEEAFGLANTMEESMEPREFLEILHVAERLKDTPRHCATSKGRRESVAEHSWRISLMAMLLKETFPEADMDRVTAMCLIHDLGECFTGDIPAFLKTEADRRTEDDLLGQWVESLPCGVSERLAALYEEMDAQLTLEAKIYKSLDKLEALIQHNESPISTWAENEYELNKTYAMDTVGFSKWLTALRGEILRDTLDKIDSGE